MMQVHASCVELDGWGILLLGQSGAGKSDLALRLIEAGGRLVADDYVDLLREDDRLLASPPAPLAGLLEVRGIGIVRFDYVARMQVGLVVELAPAAAIERLPERAFRDYLDIRLPLWRLSAFESSAVAKVRLGVRTLTQDILHSP